MILRPFLDDTELYEPTFSNNSLLKGTVHREWFLIFTHNALNTIGDNFHFGFEGTQCHVGSQNQLMHSTTMRPFSQTTRP